MDFNHSGVPNLDLVLGGGLVNGSMLMIIGAPGSGKTILAQQIAFHAAQHGQQVLVLTTLSEPHMKLLNYLRTLDFFDERLLGERVELLNIYHQLRADFDQVGSSIVRLARERRAQFVVLDSFDSVRDLAPSEVATKEFIYELSASLGLLGVTMVVVSAYMPGIAMTGAELAIADNIVALAQELHHDRSVRTLEVLKMRGAAQRTGRHSYHIGASGFQIFPRQETVPLPLEQTPDEGRAPFGLTEFDVMLAGGLTWGSSTTLIGNPGTGKTLLGLHFILEGHRRREPSLYISFQETVQQVLAKAAPLGLDLPAALNDNAIFVHRVPADLDADEVAAVIREQVSSQGVRRLVIDSLDDLLGGLSDPQRQFGFIAALLAYLRNAGVTVCLTQEIRVPIGGQAQPKGTSFSAYSDNIMLLHQMEHRATLHRVISIVKMRHSAHDQTFREFTIGPGGLAVLAPAESQMLEKTSLDLMPGPG